MRKFLTAALMLVATFTAASAQQQQRNASPQSVEEISRLARAPTTVDGIGRAVVVVTDDAGNPVPGANAKLESVWGGDHFCEAWGSTNANGALALGALHLGKLKMVVKAKGFQSQTIEVDPMSLDKPVQVKLVRK